MILTLKFLSIGRKWLAECKTIKIKGGQKFGKFQICKLFLRPRFGKMTFLSALSELKWGSYSSSYNNLNKIKDPHCSSMRALRKVRCPKLGLRKILKF